MPILRDGQMVQELRATDESFRSIQQAGDQANVVYSRPGFTAVAGFDTAGPEPHPAAPVIQDESIVDGLSVAAPRPSDDDGTGTVDPTKLLPEANTDLEVGNVLLNVDQASQEPSGVTSTLSTFPLDHSAEVDMDDAVAVTSDEEQSIGDDETQRGPARKVKRHLAMSKEQQESHILQLKATIKMFNADPSSRDFKNAPPSLEQTRKTSSSSDATPSVSNLTEAHSGVRKRGRPRKARLPFEQGKVGRPSKGTPQTEHQKKQKEKKEKKKAAFKLPEEMQSTIEVLQKLDKPFKRDIAKIVDHVSGVLDAQPESEHLMKELLEIENRWIKDHDDRRQEITAFMQRFGMIPIGGVEAMAEVTGGNDAL